MTPWEAHTIQSSIATLSHRAQEDERQTDLITGAWTASGKVYGYAQFMMI